MDLTDTDRTRAQTDPARPTVSPTLTLSELLVELGVADDEALPRFWD